MDTDCLGFNSNGWLKHYVKDESQWYKWTNDPSLGFYVKRALAPSPTPVPVPPTPSPTTTTLANFDFTPFMDSGSNDIRKSLSGNVDGYAEECSMDTDCLGFNSNGWLKHYVSDESQWYKWTNDPSLGFYVKKA